MTITGKQISDNLRREIETCGKSKAEIAKAMDVTPSTISQYCSGHTQPTLENLARLCMVIGCSADDILGIRET